MVKWIRTERQQKRMDRAANRVNRRRVSKQQGFGKSHIMEFHNYMGRHPKSSAAAAARHLSKKWNIHLSSRNAQRWNAMTLAQKQALFESIDSGLVGADQMRIRKKKSTKPELEKRLKKRVMKRIKSKLPRGKKWMRKEALSIARELGDDEFVCSDSYLARFQVRNLMSMKTVTSNRKTDIYKCLEQQELWLKQFRATYGGESDLTYSDGNFNDEMIDNADEFPIILDCSNKKHVEENGSKTCQVIDFDCTFDCTKRVGSGISVFNRQGTSPLRWVVMLKGSPSKKEQKFYRKFKNIHVTWNAKGYNNGYTYNWVTKQWSDDWMKDYRNRGTRHHNLFIAGKFDEFGEKIQKMTYRKRLLTTDNLDCHTEDKCLNNLGKANIDNVPLIKNQTDKIQPADRHVIRFVQAFIQRKFDALREKQADQIEKKQPHKRYDLSAMRKYVVQWFSEAVDEVKQRKGLLRQAWNNLGIFYDIEGEQDHIWKKSFVNCEKRKLKKGSKYRKRRKEQELMQAFKEMIEKDSLAQGILNGSDRVKSVKNRKKKRKDAVEKGMETGEEEGSNDNFSDSDDNNEMEKNKNNTMDAEDDAEDVEDVEEDVEDNVEDDVEDDVDDVEEDEDESDEENENDNDVDMGASGSKRSSKNSYQSEGPSVADIMKWCDECVEVNCRKPGHPILYRRT